MCVFSKTKSTQAKLPHVTTWPSTKLAPISVTDFVFKFLFFSDLFCFSSHTFSNFLLISKAWPCGLSRACAFGVIKFGKENNNLAFGIYHLAFLIFSNGIPKSSISFLALATSSVFVTIVISKPRAFDLPVSTSGKTVCSYRPRV